MKWFRAFASEAITTTATVFFLLSGVATSLFHLTFRIAVVDLSGIHKRPLYTGTITATVAAPQATPPGHALNEIYVAHITFVGNTIDDLLDELVAFADQHILKDFRKQWAK